MVVQQQSVLVMSPMRQQQAEASLIATAVTGLFASVFGTGALATALGALATSAISYGLNWLISELFAPDPVNGQAPLIQEIPYIIFAVGECRLGGSYMLHEEHDGELYMVQAIAGHPSEEITGYYIHQDKVELNSEGFVLGLEDGSYGDANCIEWEHRLGAVPEVPYEDHVAAFTGPGLWTPNHRLDGQTSIALRCAGVSEEDYPKYFPRGRPEASVVGKWAKVWDPRDGSQSPDDPSTWKWSNNPVICLIWHECFNVCGARRDYTKAILPVLDLWIAEANVCDELIPISGGSTQKRYRCSGWDTAKNPPTVFRRELLKTCDGWLCERGDGALLIVVGKLREEYIGTLTDADLAGTPRVDYGFIHADGINKLVPIFNYAENDYTKSPADAWEDLGDQAISGLLSQECDLPFVTNYRQARRLAHRQWQYMRSPYRGMVDMKLSGLNACYHRWVRVRSSHLLRKFNGKVIELGVPTVNLQKGSITAKFVQVPDDLELWNPSMEGQKPPIPPKDEKSPPAGANMTILGIAPVQYQGATVLRISLSVPQNKKNLSFVSRWREAGDAEAPWVQSSHPNSDPPPIIVSLRTGAVPVDVELEVQAGVKYPNGSVDHTESEFITVVLEPPAPPTGVSVSGSGTVSWTAPDDQNYAYGKVYFAPVDNFKAATFSPPSVAGVAGGSYSKSVGSLPGAPDSVEYTQDSDGNITEHVVKNYVVYAFWVTSLGKNGMESAPVKAAGTVTVD